MRDFPLQVARRKNFKNPRLAKANRLYSRADVMEVYDVSRNTVQNWRNAGLVSIEAEPRLFRGDELNAFHKRRREDAKCACDFDEIYCVGCKCKHSLLQEAYEIALRSQKHIAIVVACPDGFGMAQKFIRATDFNVLEELRKTKSSAENHDYSASLVSAEVGQLPEVERTMMSSDNATIVYSYQRHLKEACGLNGKSIDAALRHIRQFERYLDEIDFKKATTANIASFKAAMIDGSMNEDRAPRSASTIVHSFGDLKVFFTWLLDRPGYRMMNPDLPKHFTPPKHLSEIAHASTEKFVSSPEQIRTVIGAMPSETIWQRRDRAAVAFLFLSGVRDGAAVSLRLKHIDIENRKVHQLAKEVRTKASKTMVTAWFPVGEDIERIVIDWIQELYAHGAVGDDPLLPKTPSRIRRIGGGFQFWATADPIRKILKSASTKAGILYFKPHSIRSTLGQLIDQLAISPEEQKAMSQNLGHEHYRTTATYYGKLDEARMHNLIAVVRDRGGNLEDFKFFACYMRTSPKKREAINTLLEG